jgi:putative peptidoglycan lipid II flippase
LNIAIIVCALIWGEGIRGLASGVLIGGVLQLAVQAPLVYKRGFRFRFARTFRHPAIRQIGKLMTPRLFSSAIYQLNNFVDSIFGSLALFVGEGGVAALYFSYRLIQFPLGIFSNALAQAILPTLSFQVLDVENHPKFKETLLFGLSSILLIMIPASAGFMVLSRLIIETLFAGGRFNEYSVAITSGALFFYSIGLFAYAAIKILQCGFFALKDTFTPTIISGVGLFLNIFLNTMLMFPMGLNGLALATSISGIVNFLLLFYIIDKRVNGLNIRWLAIFSLKVLISSIGMAAVCVLAMRSNITFAGPIATRVARLVFPISLGLVSYIIFCWGLRIEQVKALWRGIHKRPPSQ